MPIQQALLTTNFDGLKAGTLLTVEQNEKAPGEYWVYQPVNSRVSGKYLDFNLSNVKQYDVNEKKKTAPIPVYLEYRVPCQLSAGGHILAPDKASHLVGCTRCKIPYWISVSETLFLCKACLNFRTESAQTVA